ncbi:hypothetical protein BH09MYX1_BH09MYX1_50510 [soil metagenome]
MIARIWVATLRVRLVESPTLEHAQSRRWVFAFFHGTQFALHAFSRRARTAVLVSRSNDGKIQAAALGLLGFTIARGSSTRGGVAGLAEIVRHVRRGGDAAFAVDGPRGPYGVAKPGAAHVAKSADAVLVPVGCAAARAWVLSRAWDRFVLPVPFSRIVIVLGAPACAADLSDAIAECNEHAHALLTPHCATSRGSAPA